MQMERQSERIQFLLENHQAKTRERPRMLLKISTFLIVRGPILC